MTKEQTELLANELGVLFKDENVVLVESREWEHYVPKHVFCGKVSGISSTQEEQNHVLCIVFGGTGYSGLDNPVLNFKTLLFTVVNGTGKKIYRSFTLAREWKDDREMAHWSRLQFALL